MIERVNDRLLAWAEQVAGWGEGRTQSVLGRLMKNGGVFTPPRGSYVVPIDVAAEECEKAVRGLPELEREVLKVFYLKYNLTPHQKAKRLRISKATMYRRVDAAHVLLDAKLFNARLPTFSDAL